MGAKTNIEWCDSTVNPTTGCEGCELWNGRRVRHCYAGNLHETRLARTLPRLYAPSFQEVRLAPGRMLEAAKWPDLRGTERPGKPWLNGLPRIIFVGDMGDFMSREVPDDYLVSEILTAIMSPDGSRHFWMLLTKQIARLAAFSQRIGGLPSNAMALTTVTSQETARARVSELMKVECRFRGISAEPLLGPVDLSEWMDAAKLSLVITGGESGPAARLANPQWFRDIRDECKAAGVAYFHKQNGEWAEWPAMMPFDERVAVHQFPGTTNKWDCVYRVGKKTAGRLLDGREWNEFPALTRNRQEVADALARVGVGKQLLFRQGRRAALEAQQPQGEGAGRDESLKIAALREQHGGHLPSVDDRGATYVYFTEDGYTLCRTCAETYSEKEEYPKVGDYRAGDGAHCIHCDEEVTERVTTRPEKKRWTSPTSTNNRDSSTS